MATKLTFMDEALCMHFCIAADGDLQYPFILTCENPFWMVFRYHETYITEQTWNIGSELPDILAPGANIA